MKSLAILGVVLIVAGIAGLAVANISFTEHKTVLDAGPLKVTKEEHHTIPVPTVAGVAAIVVGFGLIFLSRRAA